MTQRANPGEVLAIFAQKYRKYRDFKDIPILDRLILMIIGRETDAHQIEPVLQKLKTQFVDWNELRLARIDDIASLIREAGPHIKDAEARALRLRELFGKIFTERHMLDAEFLRDEDKENRAAFLAGLPGVDFAMVQAIECSLQAERDEVPLSNPVQRVMQRLQWCAKGNAFSITAARKTFKDIAAGDPVNLTYALVRIAEDYCHSRFPACPNCILFALCPTGRKWGKEKESGAKDEAEDA